MQTQSKSLSPIFWLKPFSLFLILGAIILFPRGGEIKIFPDGNQNSVPTTIVLPPGTVVNVDVIPEQLPKDPQCGDNTNLFEFVGKKRKYIRSNNLLYALEQSGFTSKSTLADFITYINQKGAVQRLLAKATELGVKTLGPILDEIVQICPNFTPPKVPNWPVK